MSQTLTLPQAMQVAVQHHQAGDLQQAQTIYQKVLQVQPNHSDASHLLGLIAYHHQNYEEAILLIQQAIRFNNTVPSYHNSLGKVLRSQGQLSQAVDSFQRALALNPNDSGYHYDLGLTRKDQHKLTEAITSYQRALSLNPNVPEILNSLGKAFQEQGKFPEAIDSFQRALTLKPRFAEAHNNLGITFYDQGKLPEAINCYHHALALNPNFMEVYNNLGNVFNKQGKFAEAIDFYQRALLLNPHSAQLHYNLGNAFSDQGKTEEAINSYQQALSLNPNFAEAHNNLGILLEKQGNYSEATASYHRTLAANPNFAEAHTNLGNVLGNQGKLSEALTSFQRALTLNPNSAQTHNNLANVLKDKGMLREAIASYQKALELLPTDATTHSNLLYTLNYSADYDSATLFAAHRQFNQQHALSLASSSKRHLNDATLSRRLKLGYISADFRQHPVASFCEPFLANHDHQQFEIFCYYNYSTTDAVTQRLQRYADHWRPCAALSDETLAEQLRQDNIDLLIDLSGHIANHRLLVLARKPAPVQATYLGYPNTTGLTAIDYHITDSYVDPEGMTEQFNSEVVVRLPNSYYCYRPPENSLPVGEVPLLRNSYVTFGTFNNYTTLNANTFAWWADILRAVPNSKLVVMTPSLNDPATRQSLEEQFARLGIDRWRLTLDSAPSTEATLRAYNYIDIALDSYPYNGATTTCEALWMGVPVVTLVGQTHVSRVGLSLLSTLRLTELIARSPQEYVNIVVKLASNPDYLQKLRASLRHRMMTSPLLDAPSFTRHLETIYLRMWENWCISPQKSHRI